jgi:hypothetical protein
MWSAVAVAVIGIVSSGGDERFDYRVAAVAVIAMLVLEMIWASKHRANVSQIASGPGSADYSRSPVRELVVNGVSKESVLAQLVSTVATELAVDTSEFRSGVYEIRRKPARGRANARLTMVDEGDSVHVRIEGRIPWWAGVDEGRSLCLVTEIKDELEKLLG